MQVLGFPFTPELVKFEWRRFLDLPISFHYPESAQYRSKLGILCLLFARFTFINWGVN
jgi:hypothetical protein